MDVELEPCPFCGTPARRRACEALMPFNESAKPNPPQPSASVVVPHQECYSENFDTWFDSPDDSAFVDGLKVGDTYKLQVSHYSIEREYVVTKVADDTNDDYEVRPVIESALTTAAGVGGLRELVERWRTRDAEESPDKVWSAGRRAGRRECANELEAALGRGGRG